MPYDNRNLAASVGGFEMALRDKQKQYDAEIAKHKAEIDKLKKEEVKGSQLRVLTASHEIDEKLMDKGGVATAENMMKTAEREMAAQFAKQIMDHAVYYEDASDKTMTLRCKITLVTEES